MTTNLVRVVDGVVGVMGLVGGIAAGLWLQSGSGRLPAMDTFVSFVLVTNVISAALNLTRAISYETRLELVCFVVMTGLATLVASLGVAIALTVAFFVGGHLEGSCREAICRRQCLKQHMANRAARPGRRGVIHRTPSYRLRRRGATGMVRFN